MNTTKWIEIRRLRTLRIVESKYTSDHGMQYQMSKDAVIMLFNRSPPGSTSLRMADRTVTQDPSPPCPHMPVLLRQLKSCNCSSY